MAITAIPLSLFGGLFDFINFFRMVQGRPSKGPMNRNAWWIGGSGPWGFSIIHEPVIASNPPMICFQAAVCKIAR